MSIAVFDSGLGGLTVLGELQRTLPDWETHYISDNEAFPYGPWAEQELVERVGLVIDRVLVTIQPELLVVACNTASTLVLPTLREKLDIPVVGVIPAIKPAAVRSGTKVIGLLATPGTVNRPYTHDLIEEFAGDCEVIRIGSSELVQIAEAKLMGTPVDRDRIWSIVAPFRTPVAEGLDTVILGCTHFPLIEDELRTAVGNELDWIQSGPAIARRVATLLEEKSPSESDAPGHAWFTEPPPVSEDLHEALLDYDLETLNLLPPLPRP